MPLLILLDSWVPGYLRRLPRHAALLADCSYRSQLILSSWRAATGREAPVCLSHGPESTEAAFSPLSAENGGLRTPDPFSAENCDLQLQRYLDVAARRYDPKPYDGKILLIRSEQQPKPVFLDHGLGWQGFAAGGIEIVTVPGDHFTMFREPGVREIAKAISAALGYSGVRLLPPAAAN